MWPKISVNKCPPWTVCRRAKHRRHAVHVLCSRRILSPFVFPHIMLYSDLWRGFVGAYFLCCLAWAYWWTCFPPIVHSGGPIVAWISCSHFMGKLTYIILARSCAVNAGGRDFVLKQLVRGMQVLPLSLHVSSFHFVSSSLMCKHLHSKGPNRLTSEKD